MANFFDLLGRIMISAVFLFSGINKILNYNGTIGWICIRTGTPGEWRSFGIIGA